LTPNSGQIVNHNSSNSSAKCTNAPSISNLQNLSSIGQFLNLPIAHDEKNEGEILEFDINEYDDDGSVEYKMTQLKSSSMQIKTKKDISFLPSFEKE
jgi:hypothetical protein